LDEEESTHGARRLIGAEERGRFDAQVGVRIARVWLTDDEALDNHRLLLIVVRGQRGLVKVWLNKVVAERTKNRQRVRG